MWAKLARAHQQRDHRARQQDAEGLSRQDEPDQVAVQPSRQQVARVAQALRKCGLAQSARPCACQAGSASRHRGQLATHAEQPASAGRQRLTAGRARAVQAWPAGAPTSWQAAVRDLPRRGGRRRTTSRKKAARAAPAAWRTARAGARCSGPGSARRAQRRWGSPPARAGSLTAIAHEGLASACAAAAHMQAWTRPTGQQTLR